MLKKNLLNEIRGNELNRENQKDRKQLRLLKVRYAVVSK
jgi:hypothetical protein